MIGLTRYDDNQVINDYKAQFGVTNPCAGQEGGAGNAIDIIIEDQPFFGAPTYCVVCPDKKMTFNVCFPPTPECFDDFIFGCGATSNDGLATEASISLFPNPATTSVRVSSNVGLISLKIYNILGEEIKSLDNLNQQNDAILNVIDYNPGIYLVSIETQNGVTSRKLQIK